MCVCEASIVCDECVLQPGSRSMPGSPPDPSSNPVRLVIRHDLLSTIVLNKFQPPTVSMRSLFDAPVYVRRSRWTFEFDYRVRLSSSTIEFAFRVRRSHSTLAFRASDVHIRRSHSTLDVHTLAATLDAHHKPERRPAGHPIYNLIPNQQTLLNLNLFFANQMRIMCFSTLSIGQR